MKDRYRTGHERSACAVKWLKEQIRHRDIEGASTDLDLLIFLLVPEKEEKCFEDTLRQVTDIIQYLANKQGFEIRRSKVSFLGNKT